MACLIFRVDGHQVARRRLDRRLVIGRAGKCDISIRDPLLSRQHCQIDFDGSHWVLTDLQSRNGTWIADQRVQSRLLGNGDQIRIGIMGILFSEGELDEPRPRRWSRKRRRPAEPSRSRGTPAAVPHRAARSVGDAAALSPAPRPRPADPPAYLRDDLYSLFARIAGASWESEVTLPSPRRAQPRPIPRPRSRNRQNTSSNPTITARRAYGKRWPGQWLLVAMRLVFLSGFLIALSYRLLG